MSIAFDVVFGVFIAAILALAVVAVRWGVRRDRVARSRRAQQPPVVGAPDGAPAAPGPAPDGHVA